MSACLIPVGSLLVPNDYLQANDSADVFGIVLESIEDLWGPTHRVYLAKNGKTTWMEDSFLRGLFNVIN